jgi:hypothetical protein
MQTIKMTLMACLTALFLASCGADSKEKVMDDSIAGAEEMATILEGVSDKASAEKAKSKLEALVAKMDKIKTRLKALGLTEEDMQKEMQGNEKYKKKMEEIMGKLMGSMMKMAMNKEIKDVLEDTMKKLK